MLWSSFSHAEPTRTWTGDEDETIEAEFLREQDGYALLKTDERTLRVPIRRLSGADQQWIDRHEELNRPREWGKPEGQRWRGRFIDVRGSNARIKLGREYQTAPLRSLSNDDHAHIKLVYEHLGEPTPDGVAAVARAASGAQAAAVIVDRAWTDTTGRTINATYLGTRGTSVLLRRKGREFVYPIERLSEDDQAWIAEQHLGKLASDMSSGWRAFTSLAFVATSGPPGPPAPAPAQTPPGFERREPPRRARGPAPRGGRPIDLPPPPTRDSPGESRRPLR